MSIIGIADFEPDMPDTPSNSSDTVFNVLPVTTVSYGPMPSHQPFSTPMNNRCQGGLTLSDVQGNVRVYSGSADKLYRLSTPGSSPTDVSQAGGYLTGAAANWFMTILNNRVIATNGTDYVQAYQEGVSTSFGPLITSGTTSLVAKYCAVIKNWLFLANTIDNYFGAQPQRTWWSAFNDPTNFPTPGTQAAANGLSDFQDQPGPHGAIMGIAGNLGTADGAVFFERAVFRIVYAGLPDIFDFIPAEGARGLLAAGALCQFGSIVYYPTEDGFYAFDGSNSTPIGKDKIDQFFYKDLQSNYLDRISCCADPSRGLIFWAYPGAGASNGNPNRLLIFSPAFNKWTATALNAVTIEFLLRGATFGKTLEQLDAFGTLDGLPFSLDSQVWLGNRSILAAFDVNHQYGYFDGPNLPAIVDTSDLEPIPGKQVLVSRGRPLIDLDSATIAGCARDKISPAVTFGVDQVQEPNGSCAMRTRGRYHRFRLKTAAGAVWSQFSGVDGEEFVAVGGR